MPAVVIDLVILILLLLIGVPIPFCFAAAIIFMVLVSGYDPQFLLPCGFYKLNSITLLAILFFIVLGILLNKTGLAKRLVDFCTTFLRRLRGNLGVVTVVSCSMFGAISGTASSAVAAIGTIMIPRMAEDGYPRGYATALVSCASVLGQLIPPSVPMIFFAWVTAQSVAGCFLATVLPGIILMVVYSFINLVMVRRMPAVKVSPPLGVKETAKEIVLKTRAAFFVLMMPALVLGSIYGGIATPTESSAMAVFYTILIGLWVYRSINAKQLWSALVGAVTTTGVIILMVFFVIILGRVYTMEGIPQLIINFFLGVSENKIVLLLMVNAFLLLVGMIMDDSSGTLLSAPLLFPIMKQLGVHPLHFAAIMGCNLGLGNVTPPTAPILYLGGRVGEVSLDKYIKPTLIFLAFGALPVTLLVTYWPDLALFLPRLLGYA